MALRAPSARELTLDLKVVICLQIWTDDRQRAHKTERHMLIIGGEDREKKSKENGHFPPLTTSQDNHATNHYTQTLYPCWGTRCKELVDNTKGRTVTRKEGSTYLYYIEGDCCLFFFSFLLLHNQIYALCLSREAAHCVHERGQLGTGLQQN